MTDDRDLEARIRALEAGGIVTEMRLTQLEGWRKLDQPRIEQLVRDGDVAEQVRAALDVRAGHQWKLWEKAAAAACAFVGVAGSLAQLGQIAGWF